MFIKKNRCHIILTIILGISLQLAATIGQAASARPTGGHLIPVTATSQQAVTQPSAAASHLFTIKAKTSVTTLYYNSTLTPLRSATVLSPVDGTVVSMFFSYGQQLTTGQQLFALKSEKLSSDYQQAVKDYVEKKQALTKAKNDASTDTVLYHAGATSHDQYQSSKTQYENAEIDLIQAKESLAKVVQPLGINPQNIETLSLDNTQDVEQALQKKFTHLMISSPASGIALFPEKDALQADDQASDSDSAANAQLQVGSSVKQQQLLLAIGDLSGLSAKIKVNEMDINRLKKGQPVRITGNAFPNITLKGLVSEVSSQASSSDGDSTELSQFNVLINIPNVTAADAKVIHVGMSTRIEIPLQNPAEIKVPIAAVGGQQNHQYVLVVTANGTQQKTSVITGETTADGFVTILKGLHDGQQIIAKLQTPTKQSSLQYSNPSESKFRT